jgi:hypothetical protein
MTLEVPLFRSDNEAPIARRARQSREIGSAVSEPRTAVSLPRMFCFGALSFDRLPSLFSDRVRLENGDVRAS